VDLRELHRAALEFLRAWTRSRGISETTPFGEIVRNERFPLVHIANLAWVDAVPEGGPAPVLAALDGAFLGTDVVHRHVLFTDPAAAYEAQAAFAGLGFQPTAEVALARVGLPNCIVNDEVELREVGRDAPEDDLRTVVRAVHGDRGYTPEESRQVHDLDRLRAADLGNRAFVGYLDGRPVASADLWPRGRFGMIGNVGTVPAYRMKGAGRTMIFRMLETAMEERVEYALLTANLSTWTPTLYKTLGFTPVGEVRGFLRPG